MFAYFWPLALVVLSNVAYQLCAKSVPGGVSPLASLTVTYLVGAVASLIFYLLLNRGGNLPAEYGKLNWASVVLGISIVGLEVGYIYAYQAGWPVSTASIVQAAVLAVILIVLGRVLYREPITWNKLAGIAVCLGGLFLINMKPR